MAEEAQATAANPVGIADPAPASPAPVEASPSGQGGAGPAAGDGFERIAPDELRTLRSNDGRFRQLQQAGHLETLQYLQDQGLTRQELQQTVDALDEGVSLKAILEYFRTPDPAPNTGGGSQPPPQEGSGPAPAGLTVDQLDQWWDRKQAKEAESRTQAEQKAAEDAANATLKEHWDKVLAEKLKVEPGTAKHRSASGLIPHALNGAIAERLQKQDPLLSAGAALQKAKSILPSPEDLARATERVTNDWKDLGNEIVSAAAAGQDGFPSGTLGAGAGGPLSPPESGSITRDQEREMIFADVRAVAQRRGESTDLS